MAVNNYEAMMVFSMKNGDETVASLKERFQALIEQSATLEGVNEWGRRLLRYPIQKETEGYYVLYLFAADPAFPAEFNRVAGITDGVLRSLVTSR
ncbi:MAG: 30S ribosomal protein S6 [Oscillospiraceae bacterium]|jgi:small subunit ribosomal protein S6|nr:30S ribosomal protein S6 [Oscillospiraceae bacterium]